MTTLAEIEDQLPWGFHDATLEGLTIDWLAQTVVLVMRFPMSRSQDIERRAQVSVSGLFFCSIDPVSPRDEPGLPGQGLWIDAREGAAEGVANLPAIPSGVFLHHILVSSWNYRTIHIAGRDARLVWLGEAEPRQRPEGALFPGDPVPDP